MGRPKGSKNIRSFDAEILAAKLGVDPVEFMLTVIKGDWKKLGFDAPTKTSFTAAGIEFEEPNIPFKDRVTCAVAVAKYLYPQKQAVTLSGEGQQAIKIVIEDYQAK